MPSSGLHSIWIGLPSTDVLGFTHIVPQGGTAGFCDTLFQAGGLKESQFTKITKKEGPVWLGALGEEIMFR
jgi:hypothetical protein